MQINGRTAILTEEATYIVSGTLDDGMLVVDADEAAKLQIVLDNASITSSTSAALYVLEADKVFVTLAEGSQNALANGGIRLMNREEKYHKFGKDNSEDAYV